MDRSQRNNPRNRARAQSLNVLVISERPMPRPIPGKAPGCGPGPVTTIQQGVDRCRQYRALATRQPRPRANRGDGPVGLYAAKNAVLVAARLGLGNTATRLLLHMALECWDDVDNPGEHPPRRYFGGRESSAIALGFLAPSNAATPAHRAVKRAVKELVDAGVITRLRSGGVGVTAEFELNLNSARPPAPHRPYPEVLVFPDGRAGGQ